MTTAEPTENLSDTPHSPALQHWLDLIGTGLIPVLPDIGRKVASAVKRTNVSLAELADVVKLDPIYTMHVVKESNRLNTRNRDTDIRNVAHCISLMGLDYFIDFVQQIPILKANIKDDRNIYYLSCLSRSLHAATQAEQWATQRHYAAPKDIYLSALLAGLPSWCLWYFAYDSMHVVEHLLTKELIPREEAERAVLGCTSDEIAMALGQQWNLPTITMMALDPEQRPPIPLLGKVLVNLKDDMPPNKRALVGSYLNSPATPVVLANELAAQWRADPHSRQTWRCIKWLSVFLNISPLKSHKQVCETAILTSHQHPIPGVLNPGAALAQLPSPQRRRTIKKEDLAGVVQKLRMDEVEIPLGAPKDTVDWEDEETTQQIKAPQPSETEKKDKEGKTIKAQNQFQAQPDDEQKATKTTEGTHTQELQKEQTSGQIFKDLCQRLAAVPPVYSNIADLFEDALESLRFGLHLDRVVLFTMSHSAKRLQAEATLGCDHDPQIKNLNINLAPANLFTDIMRKPKSAWVAPHSTDNPSGIVGGAFRAAVDTDDFFIISIFCGKRAIAMLYADRGTDASKRLSEPEYKAFRVGGLHMSKCITRMSQKH